MFEYVGSCRMFFGDPTTALGADMNDLGFMEDVAVDFGVRLGFTSNSNIAGAPLATGIHYLTPLPVVQAQVRDGDIANLNDLILDSSLLVTALGIGSEFTLIAAASVPTLVIIPDKEKGQGVAAPHAIWIPAALPDGVNGINFTRPSQGEIGQPYNVQFVGAYRDEDQAATTIVTGYRMAWMGDPNVVGLALTWSLPAGA